MIKYLREPSMQRLIVFSLPLFVAATALAQSTQHNESDLDLVNRLTAKTEYLASRVDNLFAVTGYERSGRSARNSGGTGFGIDRSRDSYGTTTSNSRGGAFVTESELNRVNRKLVSVSRKLKKQQESLESGEQLSEKQLAKRTKKLQQIDKDLENLQRDIDVMEKQL